MRGYPKRTLATRAKWLLDTRKDAEVSATEWVEEMEATLKELANAPQPEPVGYTNETELDYVRTYEALPVSGAFWSTSDEDACVALYTAPPAPSVPDATWQCPDCVEATERDKMKGGAA